MCLFNVLSAPELVLLYEQKEIKHGLRSSIPSAPACKGGPANLLVGCWTAKQWVQDTKKILAKKIVVIGHEFHYDQ